MFPNFRKPEKFSKSPEQTGIVLWGPSDSGKDWLFRAMIRELEYFNLHDHEFEYEIFKVQPGSEDLIPVTPELPTATNPVPDVDDSSYTFRRLALLPDSAHQINTQTHNIVVHHHKGSDLIGCLDDRIQFEDTFQALINSQNILLVLGLPNETPQVETTMTPVFVSERTDNLEPIENDRFDKEPVPDEIFESDSSRSLSWSRFEYLQFMKLFLTALGKTRRNLAVCLAKSDQLNLRGDPWQVLQRRFGDAFKRQLEVYNQNHNINVFNTSAAGFIKKDGRVMPNFLAGSLREPNRWDPINTAAPFFWIFEQIERERLSNSSKLFRNDKLKKYIPYPKPRPF